LAADPPEEVIHFAEVAGGGCPFFRLAANIVSLRRAAALTEESDAEIEKALANELTVDAPEVSRSSDAVAGGGCPFSRFAAIIGSLRRAAPLAEESVTELLCSVTAGDLREEPVDLTEGPLDLTEESPEESFLKGAPAGGGGFVPLPFGFPLNVSVLVTLVKLGPFFFRSFMAVGVFVASCTGEPLDLVEGPLDLTEESLEESPVKGAAARGGGFVSLPFGFPLDVSAAVALLKLGPFFFRMFISAVSCAEGPLDLAVGPLDLTEESLEELLVKGAAAGCESFVSLPFGFPLDVSVLVTLLKLGPFFFRMLMAVGVFVVSCGGVGFFAVAFALSSSVNSSLLGSSMARICSDFSCMKGLRCCFISSPFCALPLLLMLFILLVKNTRNQHGVTDKKVMRTAFTPNEVLAFTHAHAVISHPLVIQSYVQLCSLLFSRSQFKFAFRDVT
jgi:hypothetical protein